MVDSIELSLAVGIVGGLATAHPLAHINLKILGVQSSQELAMVIASVGLAQNFAALRALVCEGIQYGHRQLHERKTKTYFVALADVHEEQLVVETRVQLVTRVMHAPDTNTVITYGCKAIILKKKNP